MKEIENDGKPEPDILRLRAEARAVLEDPDRLPVLVCPLMTAQRHADGKLIGAICDAERAIMRIDGMEDRQYVREPGETVEDFTKRITRDLPVRYEGPEMWPENGGPGLGMHSIILFPPEESRDKQAQAPA